MRWRPSSLVRACTTTVIGVADVIAGAGFGILSVELAYLTYFPIRNAIARKINMKGNDRLVVAPTFRPDGGGLYLSWKF